MGEQLSTLEINVPNEISISRLLSYLAFPKNIEVKTLLIEIAFYKRKYTWNISRNGKNGIASSKQKITPKILRAVQINIRKSFKLGYHWVDFDKTFLGRQTGLVSQ